MEKLAKKNFGTLDNIVYFPLILNPAFRNVISKPYFLSSIFFLVVINDSKEILYIVKSSMYPFVSFWIKSFGKSIIKLLSHCFIFKSPGFLFNEEKILLKI